MRQSARWLAGCGACLLLAGCRASQPGPIETTTMQWVKHHVTVGGAKDRNPLTQNASVIHDGQTAFGDYCEVCHGLDGQNTGVPFAANVSPPIPSLASPEVQRYSDGQLKWIIEYGISPSGMPASRGILSDEEMWSIVEYLRHLPAAGSLGEPRAYSGDDSETSSAQEDPQPSLANRAAAGAATAKHRERASRKKSP